MSYFGEFPKDIQKFNEMYKLPNNDKTVDLGSTRLLNFHDILKEEVAEGIDIVNKLDAGSMTNEVAAELADWLGDIIVYCASEARRWGIPIDETLKIIMDSNFSKLGADGNPIYDERGKVMKGPSYWKPEPKLLAMLAKRNAGDTDV